MTTDPPRADGTWLSTGLLAVPVLRMHGGELIEANAAAVELLGVVVPCSVDEIARGLYGADAEILTAAIDGAGEGPSTPALVRWGTVPPVRFVEIVTRRMPDGDVIVTAVDRTEQYRLDAATTASGSALFFADRNGVITWISPLSAKVLAASPEAFVGVDIVSLAHPDDAGRLRRRLDDVVSHPGTEMTGAFRLRHPLVGGTWWALRVAASYQPDRPAVGAIVVRLDVSIDTDGEEHGEHPPRLHSIAELTPAGIVAAAGGRLNLRNALARNLVGPLLDEADPYRWADAAHVEQRAELREQLRRAAVDGHRGSMRVEVDGPDGVTRWLRIEILPTTAGSGHHVGYVATLLDVTAETTAREELRAAQEQLWELANHDTLTGLPNRMNFGDRLEQALARERREHQAVALLYGDLDSFKPVNDTLGHDAGDRVLVEVAGRIRNVTRETDTLCRYGGDEFVVLCERFTDIAEVQAVAQRIVESVARPITVDGNEVRVGISIGIAVADGEVSADRLLTRADDAMYEAKRAGKGCVVLARS